MKETNNEEFTLLKIEERMQDKTLSSDDLKFLKEHADNAHPRICADYGMCLFLGLDGGEVGFDRALEYFDKASESGSGIVNMTLYSAYKGSFKFMCDYLDRAELCLKRAIEDNYEPAVREYKKFAAIKEETIARFAHQA